MSEPVKRAFHFLISGVAVVLVSPLRRVCVLPSYYPEGIPRSLIEAMAVARPIITTDTPGCRETVEDGRNGYLVKPRDIDGLTAAMERFIHSPELAAEMGAASREIAVARFDVRRVNAAMVRAILPGSPAERAEAAH